MQEYFTGLRSVLGEINDTCKAVSTHHCSDARIVPAVSFRRAQVTLVARQNHPSVTCPATQEIGRAIAKYWSLQTSNCTFPICV